MTRQIQRRLLKPGPALLILVQFLFYNGPVAAQQGAQRKLTLTVYNQDFGVVRDQRTVELAAGLIEHRFADVAQRIDPTSVQFICLTNPTGCSVVEQNYQYDLVSTEKLLEKYIDRQLQLVLAHGSVVDGTLLSFKAHKLTVQLADGTIQIIARNKQLKRISLSQLPEGLITRPTLLWRLANDRAGFQAVQVIYQTAGLNWHVDYTLDLTDKKQIDLDGWVTIINRSGASYPAAALKLVAGDVHKVKPKPEREYLFALAERAPAARKAQFEEKPFAQYHLYTLQGRSSILQNQTKQIELLTAQDIPIKKLYIFQHQQWQTWRRPVDFGQNLLQPLKVQISFKNDKQSNLGMPLPKGKIRIYMQDSDGQRQLVATDSIDHTPADELVKVNIGRAFEVLGSRKITDHRQISKLVSVQNIQITLRNDKAQQVPVKVIERLSGQENWQIEQANTEYQKEDFQTITFTLDIPANSQKIIEYRLRYSRAGVEPQYNRRYR